MNREPILPATTMHQVRPAWILLFYEGNLFRTRPSFYLLLACYCIEYIAVAFAIDQFAEPVLTGKNGADTVRMLADAKLDIISYADIKRLASIRDDVNEVL